MLTKFWKLQDRIKDLVQECTDLGIQLDAYKEEEMRKFQDYINKTGSLVGQTIAIEGSVKTTSVDVEKNTFTLEIEANGAPIEITMRMMHLQKLKF